MLKKIKKFKIHIRPSYVLRNLKRTLPSHANEEELEKRIQQEIEKVQQLLSPSAIYQTYSKRQSPQFLNSLWQNGPADAISISLIAASLGSSIEKEIEKSRNHSTLSSDILDAIAKEALEQSLNFVLKLITEEAKEENCGLSVTFPLESTYLEATLSFLEAAKADIHSDPDGHLSPLYSSVSYCFWQPAKKLKSAKTR